MSNRKEIIMELHETTIKILENVEEQLELMEDKKEKLGLMILAMLKELNEKGVRIDKEYKYKALKLMDRCQAGSKEQRLEYVLDEDKFKHMIYRSDTERIYRRTLEKGL